MKRMPVTARIEKISRDFLGAPYQINPLIGTAETPEVFVASTKAFDCVTYMETVLGMALAESSRDFTRQLKRLRYRSGYVSWINRNHYMTDWIRHNARAGLLRQVSLAPAVVKERVLSVLPGLPPQKHRFKCIPKKFVPAAEKKFRSGDLIFFASTRPRLDVFHCGIVIRSGDRLKLRHASRNQGGVVEQDLSDFLKRNRMAGVIVARPVERR